ncbi:MAG: DUF2169 domain-containing protein, partial [Myxococcota bacterium]|nr:DUF2169 domain-containing protein [Myxococcota bacterium]
MPTSHPLGHRQCGPFPPGGAVPEFEEDGYQGLWLPGTRLSGEPGVAVVVKRRFDVDVELGICVAAEQTDPVRLTPESSNEEDPSRGVVTRAAEAALEKPRVDVLVLGEAHAPEGKAIPEFQVRIRVGDRLDRRLNILGPREARAKKTGKKKKGKKGEPDTPAPITITFTRPKPISSLPLTYEYAYGGRGLFRVGCEDVQAPEPPPREVP